MTLAVAAKPLGFGAVGFQAGEYVVMRVVSGQVQAEVNASSVDQPQ